MFAQQILKPSHPPNHFTISQKDFPHLCHLAQKVLFAFFFFVGFLGFGALYLLRRLLFAAFGGSFAPFLRFIAQKGRVLFLSYNKIFLLAITYINLIKPVSQNKLFSRTNFSYKALDIENLQERLIVLFFDGGHGFEGRVFDAKYFGKAVEGALEFLEDCEINPLYLTLFSQLKLQMLEALAESVYLIKDYLLYFHLHPAPHPPQVHLHPVQNIVDLLKLVFGYQFEEKIEVDYFIEMMGGEMVLNGLEVGCWVGWMVLWEGCGVCW